MDDSQLGEKESWLLQHLAERAAKGCEFIPVEFNRNQLDAPALDIEIRNRMSKEEIYFCAGKLKDKGCVDIIEETRGKISLRITPDGKQCVQDLGRPDYHKEAVLQIHQSRIRGWIEAHTGLLTLVISVTALIIAIAAFFR